MLKLFFFLSFNFFIKGKENLYFLYNKCLNNNYFLKHCPLFSEYENGVSICITAFKSKKFIKRTLDSIANQTWFKNHNNYEIILGIDGCNETLNYIKKIKSNYSNLIIFMMKNNQGTYITTNTIMLLSKYDHLIRFDSDDIMFPDFVQKVMINNYDFVQFKMKNFNVITKQSFLQEAYGQFMMKHWVFDYFGGFLPWKCSADEEFKKRVRKFIKVLTLNEPLLIRNIHPNSLTQSNATNFSSDERKKNLLYIKTKTSQINNFEQARIKKIINDYYEIK
jgi:glycosyltransferase involved in cell wall biosynthesis